MTHETVGRVTAILANYYQVMVSGESQPRLCKPRALLKKTGERVWVGDQVRLATSGAIQEILPRTSYLSRPAIANVSRVVLVFSGKSPDLDLSMASRLLVLVEHCRILPVIVLNKADLLKPEEIEALDRTFKSWGYSLYPVSTHSGTGLTELCTQLAHQVAVLAGPSGVGKSSLLNALQPGLHLRVGEVSTHQGQGKHTTRHVELFTLPGAIQLADTPGFSQTDLTMAPSELADCFPEFRPLVAECQFRNCLHQEEPDCAVRQANLERYSLYRVWLTELEHTNPARKESLLKSQQRTTGQIHIPKLTSAQRRPSRRTRKQQWEDTEETSLS